MSKHVAFVVVFHVCIFFSFLFVSFFVTLLVVVAVCSGSTTHRILQCMEAIRRRAEKDLWRMLEFNEIAKHPTTAVINVFYFFSSATFYSYSRGWWRFYSSGYSVTWIPAHLTSTQTHSFNSTLFKLTPYTDLILLPFFYQRSAILFSYTSISNLFPISVLEIRVQNVIFPENFLRKLISFSKLLTVTPKNNPINPFSIWKFI